MLHGRFVHVGKTNRFANFGLRIAPKCICRARAQSICLSVAVVSTAKTGQLIEMSFELRTLVDPQNHVLDGVQIPIERVNFEGEGAAHPNV